MSHTRCASRPGFLTSVRLCMPFAPAGPSEARDLFGRGLHRREHTALAVQVRFGACSSLACHHNLLMYQGTTRGRVHGCPTLASDLCVLCVQAAEVRNENGQLTGYEIFVLPQVQCVASSHSPMRSSMIKESAVNTVISAIRCGSGDGLNVCQVLPARTN